MNEDLELLTMTMDHYRRLWLVLEDLDTLLWKIKGLNDELIDLVDLGN
jgi:hypothetical protein